ncbi:MAG: PIG-L family deacetylase [Myxococcota bacterium]
MLKPVLPSAQVFIPDGAPWEQATARITHLAVAAHADDVELMAWHGIQRCLTNESMGFAAVIVTDGRGSPRSGAYAQFTSQQMRDVRLQEQKRAAQLGRYGLLVWLDHESASIKTPHAPQLQEDLRRLFQVIRPRLVYTHNLVDKHDTHVAVATHLIRALRSASHQPERVLGCEVWRGLDWLTDEDKVLLDVSGQDDRMMELMRVFDSQISGGKRYDLAAAGRKRSNATFLESHAVDQASAVEYAMDLTPLVRDSTLELDAWTEGFIQRFSRDVAERLRRFIPGT